MGSSALISLFWLFLFHLSPTLANHANTNQHQHLKRGQCGLDIGNCGVGECCSRDNLCGTGPDYCSLSNCQILFSNSCDVLQPPPGDSTENIPRPQIGSIPYGQTITGCKKPKSMALTFDDGPGPYTLQLLDLLDKYNVKATFFVNGGVPARGRMDDATTPWPAILQRMYLSGHQIANHSWSHRKLDKVDNSTRRNEMIYNEMAFRNVFGFIPTYMRAPYFRCAAESGCLDYMNQLGYHVVDRTIETRESFGAPKTRFLQGLKSKNGAYIVSAHDSRLDTVSVLAEFMIITAKARGYELMTVGECLGDPKENWYREAPSRGILKSAAQLKPHPRALEEE